MTSRAVALLVIAALLLSACASETERLTVDDLDDVAAETELRPRQVTLETGTGETAIRVVADVSDAYRYRATVSFGGVDTYDELVIDDRRWVRIASPALQDRLGPDVARCLPDPAADPAVAATAVQNGGWVLDAAGAPPEFPGPDVQRWSVDPLTALHAVRFLEDLPELLDEAAWAGEWNPRALYYVPAQDRFEPHAELGVRFDALPPEDFDADAVFRDGIPPPSDLEDHFRYVAVWVDDADGMVRRVEVLSDVPDLSGEIARAQQAEAERRGVDVGDRATPAPLPSSSHTVFTVTADAQVVPPPPAGAPTVDFVCLATPEVEAPVVAEPAAPDDGGEQS